MKQTDFQIVTGAHALHCYRWLPERMPRATLLIVHGLAEHAARYKRLAGALTGAGHAAYALDLPGHGRTARSERELGVFAEREGWRAALDAIAALHARAAGEQPGRPLFVLGHSMGSFLVQDYLVEHGARLAGAVLSATSGDLGALRPIGLGLLSVERLLFGAGHKSALAELLSFRDFNRKFQPSRTDFDWLSRDPAEVDKYIADPLCGFRASCGLWTDLLAAGAHLRDLKRLARIPRDLPILMVAGSRDPATRGEYGPHALEDAYLEAGLGDVTVSIYDDGRHELFNDLCRDEVTAELLAWIGNHLPP